MDGPFPAVGAGGRVHDAADHLGSVHRVLRAVPAAGKKEQISKRKWICWRFGAQGLQRWPSASRDRPQRPGSGGVQEQADPAGASSEQYPCARVPPARRVPS